MRLQRILGSAAAGVALASLAVAQNPPSGGPQLARSLEVPFDYDNPAAGLFSLYYELGKDFDPSKPTVFVIVDGQQFYVRRNSVRNLQDSLFGDRFNVVGIPGRGTEPAVLKRVDLGSGPDWHLAWTVLRSHQWVEDIERVRRAVVGPRGRVSLYGRSGGGLLVHQYLAKYGEHASTVFTQAAVNRFIDAEIGLSSDTFWTEVGRVDPHLQTMLLEAVERRPDERDRIVLLLQRQNFFVPAESIPKERTALIQAIAQGDESALRRYATQYQVEDIIKMMRTPPISVRLFELFAPVLTQRRSDKAARIDPDLEVGELFGAPLIRLLNDGRIQPPTMDLGALHRVVADVYLLAARFDHTADYRSQLALASHYPNHRLLLLADDHNFIALQKAGIYPALVQSALARGIRGPREEGIEEQLSVLVYREYQQIRHYEPTGRVYLLRTLAIESIAFQTRLRISRAGRGCRA